MKNGVAEDVASDSHDTIGGLVGQLLFQRFCGKFLLIYFEVTTLRIPERLGI